MNNSLEEVYLCYNSFGIDGCTALAECIKYNKVLKLISLRGNQLTHECASILAEGLSKNSTLKSLFVSIFRDKYSNC